MIPEGTATPHSRKHKCHVEGNANPLVTICEDGEPIAKLPIDNSGNHKTVSLEFCVSLEGKLTVTASTGEKIEL